MEKPCHYSRVDSFFMSSQKTKLGHDEWGSPVFFQLPTSQTPEQSKTYSWLKKSSSWGLARTLPRLSISCVSDSMPSTSHVSYLIPMESPPGRCHSLFNKGDILMQKGKLAPDPKACPLNHEVNLFLLFPLLYSPVQCKRGSPSSKLQ